MSRPKVKHRKLSNANTHAIGARCPSEGWPTLAMLLNDLLHDRASVSIPHSCFCLAIQCFSPRNGWCSHTSHISFQLFYHPLKWQIIYLKLKNDTSFHAKMELLWFPFVWRCQRHTRVLFCKSYRDLLSMGHETGQDCVADGKAFSTLQNNTGILFSLEEGCFYLETEWFLPIIGDKSGRSDWNWWV